ncbi:MAG: VCBS repeat-containing protein, partial [Deltaproteobacteria bacterium]|nr:VCBS repeat-containing protein [Deltaproteobacteria bacterium]
MNPHASEMSSRAFAVMAGLVLQLICAAACGTSSDGSGADSSSDTGKATFELTEVVPAEGTALGGEEVELRGTGFTGASAAPARQSGGEERNGQPGETAAGDAVSGDASRRVEEMAPAGPDGATGWRVFFGEEEGEVLSVSAQAVRVRTPRHLAGLVDVSLEKDGAAVALEQAFRFIPLPLSFVDYTLESLDADPVEGTSALLADVDKDGDLDIVQAVQGGPARLFFNTAAKFKQAPAENLPEESLGNAVGMAALDADRDGDLDIYIAIGAMEPDRLYLNDGTGRFEAAADDLLPAAASEATAAVLAADLDGNGTADLVLASDSGTRLLRNDAKPGNGDVVLADVTAEVLPLASVPATGVAGADVEADGDLDLVITGFDTPCRLYLNDGKGVFKLAAPDALPSDSTPQVFGPAMADFNRDGLPDLFLLSAAGNRVLFNDGAGRFMDMTDLVLGPGDGLQPVTATAVDLDLGGYADVVVGNASAPATLLRNDGSGRLYDYTSKLPGNQDGSTCYRACAGDLDGDGDLDLFMSRSADAPSQLLLSRIPGPQEDPDGDNILSAKDNCPGKYNPGQEDHGPASAPILIESATDASEDLYLDGTVLSSSSDWKVRTAVPLDVAPGPHVLGKRVSGVAGQDRGGNGGGTLLAVLDGQGKVIMHTKAVAAWKATDTAPPPEWLAPDFDDSAFTPLAKVAAYGEEPYLPIEGWQDDTADWIWPKVGGAGPFWVRIKFEVPGGADGIGDACDNCPGLYNPAQG